MFDLKQFETEMREVINRHLLTTDPDSDDIYEFLLMMIGVASTTLCWACEDGRSEETLLDNAGELYERLLTTLLEFAQERDQVLHGRLN